MSVVDSVDPSPEPHDASRSPANTLASNMRTRFRPPPPLIPSRAGRAVLGAIAGAVVGAIALALLGVGLGYLAGRSGVDGGPPPDAESVGTGELVLAMMGLTLGVPIGAFAGGWIAARTRRRLNAGTTEQEYDGPEGTDRVALPERIVLGFTAGFAVYVVSGFVLGLFSVPLKATLPLLTTLVRITLAIYVGHRVARDKSIVPRPQ
jgi:MFS family permease